MTAPPPQWVVDTEGWPTPTQVQAMTVDTARTLVHHHDDQAQRADLLAAYQSDQARWHRRVVARIAAIHKPTGDARP